MARSIIATILILGCVPTLGYLAAGQVCFLMGFANIPGFKMWRAAKARRSVAGEWIGVVFGWLGQAIISGAFAFLLVKLAHVIFAHVEILSGFRWLIWASFFLLAYGPIYMTRQVSHGSSDEEGRHYFMVTLAMSGLTTQVGYVYFAVTGS
jgi:hypothetical protein